MIYDFAVAGGSFAGISFALSCSQFGRKGVILEKKKSHHDFVHTTGIIVQEAIDYLDLPLNLCKKINRVKLYSPSMKSVDLYRQGYSFYATDTKAFLTNMLKRAEASGVKVQMGQSFKSCFSQNDILTINNQFKSRFLVGADGAKSQVAQNFGLSKNRAFLTGVEWEFDSIPRCNDQCLHVFISKKYAPGYIGWIVPGPNSFQVGLAVKDGLKPDIRGFIGHISKCFDLSRSTVINRRGGLIPCGKPVKNVGFDNVLLLGDAAGTVSPLTAGGIHKAIELGIEAGSWVNNYLNGGIEPAVKMKKVIPSYQFKGFLRQGFDKAQPADLMVNLLFESKIFKAFAQTVFFHNRGFFSKEAWKDFWSLIRQPEYKF